MFSDTIEMISQQEFEQLVAEVHETLSQLENIIAEFEKEFVL